MTVWTWMIDVGRDDGASGRYFNADKLSDLRRDALREAAEDSRIGLFSQLAASACCFSRSFRRMSCIGSAILARPICSREGRRTHLRVMIPWRVILSCVTGCPATSTAHAAPSVLEFTEEFRLRRLAFPRAAERYPLSCGLTSRPPYSATSLRERIQFRRRAALPRRQP